MKATVMIPADWRRHMTDDERDAGNRWSMWGHDCIGRVGRRWDSTVKGAPLFRTRKAAYDFLTRYVCDAIPLACALRSAD